MCSDSPVKANHSDSPVYRSESSVTIPSNGLYNSSDFIIENNNENSQSCLQVTNIWCHQTGENIFRKKTLYRLFPIFTWLPQYNRSDFIGDLVAGITVALTAIPLGLAFAGIAGLDLQYGLYGCFLCCFVYILVGSSRDVATGPTAISALLTLQAAQGSWEKAVLFTFLTGLIEIAMGVLRLGFLIDFVSGPVSAGFISAVALIIFTSQLHDILGVNIKGDTFLKMWSSIIEDIHNISWYDASLGATCVLILLAMRPLTGITFGPEKGKTRWQQFCTQFFWLIGTARNAVLVCATSGLGYYLIQSGKDIFRMVGYVPEGLPDLRLPPFSIHKIMNTTDGETIEVHESFTEMVSSMGSGLIVVPLVSLLENMTVVQAFANGRICDATQELIAMGLCNVANSFAQGFRGNGGLARGSVLNASGRRTQLSNLYTGLVVMAALLYMTPAFYYIPRSVLAAIIVAAVIFMVQYRVIKPMWQCKKTDLIPGIATFIASLILPMQIGILVGIGINILFILYHAARPKLTIEQLTTPHGINYLMLTPDRSLIFPSVEFVRNVVNKQGRKSTLPIVINCTYIYGADFTAAKTVATMINDFETRRQKLYFYNLQSRVAHVLQGLNKDLTVFYDMATLEMELLGKIDSSKL